MGKFSERLSDIARMRGTSTRLPGPCVKSSGKATGSGPWVARRPRASSSPRSPPRPSRAAKGPALPWPHEARQAEWSQGSPPRSQRPSSACRSSGDGPACPFGPIPGGNGDVGPAVSKEPMRELMPRQQYPQQSARPDPVRPSAAWRMYEPSPGDPERSRRDFGRLS